VQYRLEIRILGIVAIREGPKTSLVECNKAIEHRVKIFEKDEGKAVQNL
jgi:hypothetical protein